MGNSIKNKFMIIAILLKVQFATTSFANERDLLGEQLQNLNRVHHCFTKCSNVLPYSLKSAIHVLQNDLLKAFEHIQTKELLKELIVREDLILQQINNDEEEITIDNDPLNSLRKKIERIDSTSNEEHEYFVALMELEEMYEILLGECEIAVGKYHNNSREESLNNGGSAINNTNYEGQLNLAVGKGIFGDYMSMEMMNSIDYDVATGKFQIRLNDTGTLPNERTLNRNEFIHRLAKRLGTYENDQERYDRQYNIDPATSVMLGKVELTEKECPNVAENETSLFERTTVCHVVTVKVKTVESETGAVIVEGFPTEELYVTHTDESEKDKKENLMKVISASTCFSMQSFHYSRRSLLGSAITSDELEAKDKGKRIKNNELPTEFYERLCRKVPQRYSN